MTADVLEQRFDQNLRTKGWNHSSNMFRKNYEGGFKKYVEKLEKATTIEVSKTKIYKPVDTIKVEKVWYKKLGQTTCIRFTVSDGMAKFLSAAGYLFRYIPSKPVLEWDLKNWVSPAVMNIRNVLKVGKAMQFITNYMIRPLGITVIADGNHKIEITEPYGDLLCWVTTMGYASTKSKDWDLFVESHKISKPTGYSRYFNYASKKVCFIKLNQLKSIKEMEPNSSAVRKYQELVKNTAPEPQEQVTQSQPKNAPKIDQNPFNKPPQTSLVKPQTQVKTVADLQQKKSQRNFNFKLSKKNQGSGRG